MGKIFIAFWVALFAIGTSGAYAANAITTGNVNLRSGPGVKHAKRGTIPAGYRLDVGHCSGNWCRVSSRRGTGWVSARYLAFNQGVRSHITPRRVMIAPPLFSIHIGRSYHRPRYYRSHRSYRPYRSHYRHHRYYRHRRHDWR